MEETTTTWKFIQTITPALIGFAGVCVGAGVANLRDYYAGRRKGKTDGAYLAAIVGGALDAFVAGCSSVVDDNGEVDTDGYSHPSADYPEFDPLKFDVEWRSIPPSLLFDIQDIPYQIRAAQASISAVSAYAAMPPEFEEFFDERQFQYARLGVHCISIAERLRAYAKLSPRPTAYQWNPKPYFENKIAWIEENRARAQSLPDF